MENLGHVENITSKKETENFQAVPTKVVMWNLEIKIFYILGHTDKDILKHLEQQN